MLVLPIFKGPGFPNPQTPNWLIPTPPPPPVRSLNMGGRTYLFLYLAFSHGIGIPRDSTGFHSPLLTFLLSSPLGGLCAASKLLSTSLQLVAGWMVDGMDGCICNKGYFSAGLKFYYFTNILPFATVGGWIQT